MKRIIASALAVCLLTGCAANKKDDQKRDRDADDETVEEVDETSESDEETEESSAEASETTEETSSEISFEETEPAVSYEYEEYYIQTINDFIANYSGDASELVYNLIYVDDDNIPELVIDHLYYSVNLYTYSDGQVYTLMDNWGYGAMGNIGYDYIPRANALYNTNSDYAGALRYEYFMWLSEDHNLVVSDDDLHYQLFPEGVDPWDYEMNMDTVYYYVNGEEVSEEVYNSYRTDGVYRAITGSYTYSEIMNFLTTETVPSTSEYSLVMSDCTWLEAEAACEAAGGHLATLNENDAYYIVNQIIENSDYPNAVVYLGGSYDSEAGQYIWSTDGSNDVIDPYSYLWRDGEPSYSGSTEDGRTVEEPYVCIAGSTENGYVVRELMDVPNDTLDAAPSYSGNIGYIIEIEY